MSFPYTDKTAVQNYTLTNIDASFDTQLTEWIAAMSEYIDQQVGYPVYTNVPSTRLYDGSGKCELVINPVITITAVTASDVAITPVQAPYNTSAKTALLLRTSVFPADLANIAVTGLHCLKLSVPNPIKLACSILVAGIVNQSNNQTDGVKSEKIGEYSVTYATAEEQTQYQWAKSVIDAHRPLVF